MFCLRRRLRPLTWIALVATLGLALLPAVSHALARVGSSGDWAEVCTAGGFSRVAAGGTPTGSDGLPATTALAHCPSCVPGTPIAGPPPAPLPLRLAASTAAMLSPVAGRAPTLRASWPPALPRAPPARH